VSLSRLWHFLHPPVILKIQKKLNEFPQKSCARNTQALTRSDNI
jgi:hypothetical protein